MKAYISFWRNCFNVKKPCERDEFILPMVVHGILFFLYMAMAVVKGIFFLDGVWELRGVWYLVGILFIVLQIPTITLIIRRLNTIHKKMSLVWLYPIFIVGGVILFVICLEGGSRMTNFNPDRNMDVCIYGPPDMMEEKQRENQEEEIIFSPDDNMNVDIYGPPDMME